MPKINNKLLFLTHRHKPGTWDWRRCLLNWTLQCARSRKSLTPTSMGLLCMQQSALKKGTPSNNSLPKAVPEKKRARPIQGNTVRIPGF